MKRPAISVVMPVYNGQQFLAQAIESILRQSFEDFEFIIVNDASTDNTEDIIRSYADHRIVYVKNEKQLRLAGTLNKAIKLSKGKYIARMDADDVSLPARLELQYGLCEKKNLDACFGLIKTIDRYGNFLGNWQLDSETITYESIKKQLPYHNCLAHPTVMIMRKTLEEYMYDESSGDAEDYNLWLKLISDRKKIYKIPDVILYYRIHADSITYRSNEKIKGIEKNVRARWNFIKYCFRKRTIASNFFNIRVLWALLKDIYSLANLKVTASVKLIIKKLLVRSGKIIGNLSSPLLTEILFVFPYYHMGGAERVHLDIVRSVMDKQIAALFTNKSKDNFFLYDFRMAVPEIFDFGGLLEKRFLYLFFLGYWSSRIARGKVRIIFGCNSLFFYDLLAVLPANIKKIDLIHAFGGGIEEYSLPYVRFIDRRIVINRQTYLDIIKQYKERKISNPSLFWNRIQIIENGVRLPGTYSDRNNENLDVIFVGRNSPEKRIERVGRVAEMSAMRSSNISFTLVGPGEDALAQRYKCFVTFKGVIKDIAAIYEKADVILTTSDREGFPMVIMEAMAYGVIPVCTDVGGLKYHIKNNVNGFLVPSNDPEDQLIKNIYEILQMLAKDHICRRRISENAYQYANEHFDIERTKRQYRDLLT